MVKALVQQDLMINQAFIILNVVLKLHLKLLC